jgi:molecular chaperone DnaK
MPEAQKTEANRLKDELKAAIDANDEEKLKTKVDEIEAAFAAAQQYMNQQAQGNDSSASSNPEQDVVDADFKEKQ